jgi:hypothetical protein
MRSAWLFALAAVLAAQQPGRLEDDALRQLVRVRRVYVDRLTGGDTAAHIREMILSSFHGARLFVVTENPDRADAVLRGSAEDLVFTDTLQTSEGVDVRASASSTQGGRTYSERSSRSGSVGVGENESARLAERRHEATAAVRLVNKDGDVIWSTTQESTGAKFRGASADVAHKITQQLLADWDRGRRLPAEPALPRP